MPMMNREELAVATAHDIHAVEAVCVSALETTMSMVARLLDNRRATGLSPTVGHSIIADLNDAASKITDALGSVVDAHRKATTIAKTWGVEAILPPTDKDLAAAPAGAVGEVVRLPRPAAA